MSHGAVKFAVTGGTPGADANTYKLFDSTIALTNGIRGRLRRIAFTVQNAAAGTLKAYWSADRGTNWNQYDSQSVAIPAAGLTSGPFDYLVDTFDDWKLEWVNGGSAQTTWATSLVGAERDRASGT